jgi:filamentous hemagglutinin
MNSLPNCEHALIEDSKLVEYALNPHNERGRHKARLFESALGFNLANWEQLRLAILDALPHYEAVFTNETPFGKKYEALLPVSGPNGRTVSVLTVWQFDRLSDGTLGDQPRLVTLYVP